MKKQTTPPKSKKASKNELNTVPPVVIKAKASKDTRDAIAFFNGKKSAVDLLKMDGRKKFVHSGYTPPSIKINWATVGKAAGLIFATAFVALVAYWGIKQ